MEITLFDYSVLGVMMFFIIIGLLRGFIRELASLINWIGGSLLTVLIRPFINEIIATKITNPIISNIISGIVIFIIAIIGLSIITSNIARTINTKFPSSINITLGLAFGFLKGFFICSLIFTTILNVFGSTEDLSTKTGPNWLKNSQTYRPLSFGAYIILPFTNSIMGQIKEKYSPPKKEDESEEIKEDSSNESTIDSLRRYKSNYDKMDNLINKEKELENKIKSKTEKFEKETGYKKDQTSKLDHLIDLIAQ